MQKQLKDVRTEVRDGQLFQIKYFADGTSEEKIISEASLKKLMLAIMREGEAGKHLRLIQGGKK